MARPTFSRKSQLKPFNSKNFIRARGKDELEKVYEVGQKIGEGSCGAVHVCHHRSTGSERAVKMIAKSPRETENKDVLSEFKIIKDLDHPNILKLYELFQDREKLYIVTDIYRGGDLLEKVLENGPLNESDAALLMLSILSCMKYCHKNKIVHRDLKLENVLLDDNKKLDDIKIIDFGISRMGEGRCIDEHGDVEGTPMYMAPETFSGFFSPKSDVWACGVIAFMVLGGTPPFYGGPHEILEQIEVRGPTFESKRWNSVSPQAKDLIVKLLHPDPSRRYSARQALEHPWLTKKRRSSRECFKRSSSDIALDSLKNLQTFHANSRMMQAACACIAAQLLPKEAKAEISRVFRAFDTDCDGKLDANDLKEAFREYHTELSEQELQGVLNRVDFTGNGTIDYWEFLIASMCKTKLFGEKTLQAAFEIFDAGRTGFVTFQSLKAALDLESEFDLGVLLSEANKDLIEGITFEDFKCIMRGTSSSKRSGKSTVRRQLARRVQDMDMSLPNHLEDYASIPIDVICEESSPEDSMTNRLYIKSNRQDLSVLRAEAFGSRSYPCEEGSKLQSCLVDNDENFISLIDLRFRARCR